MAITVSSAASSWTTASSYCGSEPAAGSEPIEVVQEAGPVSPLSVMKAPKGVEGSCSSGPRLVRWIAPSASRRDGRPPEIAAELRGQVGQVRL